MVSMQRMSDIDMATTTLIISGSSPVRAAACALSVASRSRPPGLYIAGKSWNNGGHAEEGPSILLMASAPRIEEGHT
jgi:hypothetical protein